MARDLHGGYDYEFVETPQDILICKICLLVSRDPHLSMCCGHVFCKSCLEKVKQSTVTPNACPVCRDQEFTTVINKQAARLVKNLLVLCSNKPRGCKWQGELNEIDNHLKSNNGCKFENVECPIGCKKLLQRHHLSNHTKECPCRLAKCEYCFLPVQHQFVNSKHKNECSRFPLPCPNKCKVSDIPREEMDLHRDVCDLQRVMCSNKCGVIIERQHLANHMQSKCTHREITCQYCLTIDKYVIIEGRHKEKCHRYPLPCPNKCDSQPIPRDEIEEHRKECPLEAIQCDYHSMGCDINICREDQKSHNEEAIEKHLQLVMSQLVVTQKKLAHAQKEVVDTKQTLVETAKELNDTKQALGDAKTQFASISSNLNLFGSTMISLCKRPLRNDSAWSMWWLPLKVNMADSGNQTFPVVIKMPEFSKRKMNKEVWHSDPFYTHDKGYKMCLCLNASGCKSQSVCSPLLHLCLMKGPYDHKLTWPMIACFNLKLLNHCADRDHVVCVPLHSDYFVDRVKVGERKFATFSFDHATLSSRKELFKDGSVIFEISKKFFIDDIKYLGQKVFIVFLLITVFIAVVLLM